MYVDYCKISVTISCIMHGKVLEQPFQSLVFRRNLTENGQRKTTKEKSSKGSASIKKWFSPDQRTSYRQGLGIILLILSVFLLSSFASSIHHFAHDHSIVTSSDPDFFSSQKLYGGNWSQVELLLY